MKRFTRIAAALLSAALMAGSFASCGSVPEGYTYVDSIIEMYYDDDPTEWSELTGGTIAEGHDLYDAAFNRTLSYFKTYYSVSSWDDDTRDQCLEMYKEIYKDKRKIKILSCTSDSETSWTVKLEITPFNLFEDADDDFIAFVAQFRDDVQSGTTTYEDKDAYLEDYAMKLVDVIEPHVDTASYGEATTLTLHVSKDEDGIFSLEDGEKGYLDVAVLPYPEFEDTSEVDTEEASDETEEEEQADEAGDEESDDDTEETEDAE